MTKFAKFVTVLLAIVMGATCLFALAACKETEFDNETSRLVLSIAELDGVFNPFFSTSATDGEIVGMTQVGMLSSDKDGNVAYGETEPCVVLDYGFTTEGDTENPTAENSTTTYTFVLKNDLKFSNGSPLTMRDVLFNLYVYLDPAYTGSSTIYSTEIVGLAEYRTQERTEAGQLGARERFELEATQRIQRLYDEIDRLYRETFKDLNQADDEKMTKALQERDAYYKDKGMVGYDTLVSDYERVKKLFRDELKSDYTMSVGTATDIKFNNDTVHLNNDTEAFLYNEGYITWSDANKSFDYTFGEECRTWTKEDAIEAVYNANIPGTQTQGILQVITAWPQTSYNLFTEFTAIATQNWLSSLGDERIDYIEGIKFINQDQPVTFENVKGQTVTYQPPKYKDDDNSKEVVEGNEVLQITIKGVDPKAIWNFAFTVAPMYYYSSPEEIAQFDYKHHFGVAMSDIDFLNDYVKDPDKIGLPMGAGPYKATTVNGDSSRVTDSSFSSGNVVYFERNEYFEFPVKIKYVNYQVVDPKIIMDSLYSGAIHFAQPNAQKENVDKVNSKQWKKTFSHYEMPTNGYGYIGINAEKVPDIHVRRAIMYAIDASLCTSFYAGLSERIYRPMTKVSWAYPVPEPDDRYPFDRTGDASQHELDISDHNYYKGSDNVLTDGTNRLEYEFTVAGDSTDHPAYNALIRARDILNELGFKITVKKDINALKKLNTGELAVWAAAWGSTVDPDMYQVYHIDSQATSTNNWGYRAIKLNSTGEYTEEKDIVERLSVKIDEARQTLKQSVRKEIYAECLNLVMDLAVEFPTYQRQDMFVWNSKVIDSSSLVPESERSPYAGPLSRLWEVSFVGNK